MDADSSYGGSDTAQDSHSAHDNSSSLETTHNDVTTAVHDVSQVQEPNSFYHKNEITLPVNYDETDFQDNKPIKQPHYLSTANLNINDTLEHHSNLEEMSKNYKSTNYLNEPSPVAGKKQVEAGVDNPAFQEDEFKQPKSTFDKNKPYNGDLNSSAILGLTSPTKKDEPLTEAVNLELINLKPVGKDVTGAYENGTNGVTSIPVKRENDAEIGNPYDEYFVPVNEHRKYMSKTRKGRNSVTFAEMIATGSGVDNTTGLSLTAPEQGVVEYPNWLTSLENTRGEKLYVTMDKRSKKKRNKCLCWGICLGIVAAAVIVGILAAVGVIGNQGSHPPQEVSARHFGSSTNEPEVKAAGGIFGLPKDLNTETTMPPEAVTQPFTPGPSVSTVSSMLPSTDTSMIQVPRALESQLVIDNFQFTPALNDKNSTEFKSLAQALETELKNSLFSSDVLNYGAADIKIKIMDFSSGSVVVKYRITWTFRDGIHNAKDPIDEDMLKRKMRSLLDQNSGFIDTYHIVGSTVTADRILDLCKIDNNGCEFNCTFDHDVADFVCSCPPGKYLSVDKKSCANEPISEPEPVTESHHDTTLHPAPEPSAEPEPAHEQQYHTHEIEPNSEPEPTTEPQLVNAHEYVHNHPTEPIHNHDHYLEHTVQPEPNTDHHYLHETPEVTSEKHNDQNHLIYHQFEPTATPEPIKEHPETTAEPTSGQHYEFHDHNGNRYQAGIHPEYISTSEISTEPTVMPIIEHKEADHHILSAIPSTEPTSEPEPTNKPDENHEHLHHLGPVEPTAEPAAEPTPEPSAEPTAEPSAEPSAEPKPEPSAEPTAEPKAEPTAEPSAEPTAEPKAEPSAEPTAEPGSIPAAEPTAIPAAEPTAEPAAEPAAEPTAEPPSVPAAEPTAEPVAEPKAEPAAEPAAEPTAEPTAEPVAEPKADPAAEPAAEPTAEPTAEPSADHKIEPIAEPTVEPVAEPTAEPSLEPAANQTDSVEVKNKESTVESSSSHEIHLVADFTTLKPEANAETTIKSTSTESSHVLIETTTPEEVKIVPSIVEHNIEHAIIGIPPTTTEFSHDNELRHNHLSEEIFAEAEPTNATSNITEDNQVNSTETVVTTKSSEMKEEIPAITTTVSSMVESEVKPEDMTTIKHVLLETTTVAHAIHEEPFIPSISINNESISEVHTTPIHTEDVTVPIIVNEQAQILKSDNVHIQTETTEPKIQEITTTPPSDMTKIFTEMHKIIDTQYDHSTEMVGPQLINDTHMDVAMMESTENTSGMDNMSPFLPEIDNDTFVNKLHLGEHIIPHIHNDTHDEDMNETSPPPRLDNDQMNQTNPADPNPVDTSLKVIPLEGHENEILDKVILAVNTSEDANQTNPNIIPVVIQQANNATDSMESEKNTTPVITVMISDQHLTNETTTKVTEDATTLIPELLNHLNDTANNSFVIPVVVHQEEVVNTERVSEESATTIHPSEIINNIHSNNFFDNMDDAHKNLESNRNATEQTNSTEVNTSTEDLIALETTTNGLIKSIDDKKVILFNGPVETTTVNQTFTSIHAEIIDTVTESISLATKEENATMSVNETTTAAAPSEEITTIMMSPDDGHQYEVKESVADVTTTEKLFVAVKATSETPIISKTDFEDLSVIPLESDEEKREANKISNSDASQNRLEAEPNDSTNDITEEEQSVIDKFNHNFNDIHPDEEISATTMKIDKTDENKSGKKNYFDKYEKNLKFDKEIGDDELLNTSAINDTAPRPFSDIKPVTEGFTIQGFARCEDGQFQCVNGTSTRDGSYCIQEVDRCDSVDDCSDGSDEVDCVKNGCPNNFQCASGQCLKRHLVCDGIQNCNDGTDEVSCDQWICRFDEFACGEGNRCLPVSWKCDGRKQCPDGSDEHHCPTSMCSEDTFRCTEQDTCIPKSWVCDGKSDCMNSEDERSCACGSDEFKCAIGGGCVKKSMLCNGIADCADKSDEWNCLRLEKESNNKKYLEIQVANNSWNLMCADNWNETHSEAICRQLGYAGVSSTETIAKPEGVLDGYSKLKSELTANAAILSQIEATNSTCDSIVSITCQDFACGSHSTLGVQSARIIGGNMGVETQWPSLTLLYNKKRNIQCTATLMAPLWAIASHSCIFAGNSQTAIANEWNLYAGSTNFFSNPDNSTTQVIEVQQILSHPQTKYSQFEFVNDVVLVELVKPLQMTRNVSTVCLPDKDIEPRQLCVIAGWGVSKPGESTKNQYLHYLPVPVIDAEECNSTKHYNGLVSDGQICAGYTDPEKTPCYNDEGAPLMCFSDSAGTWELQGVLNHHDNCAKSKHPAIYTAINEKIRRWVVNTIGHKPTRSV